MKRGYVGPALSIMMKHGINALFMAAATRTAERLSQLSNRDAPTALLAFTSSTRVSGILSGISILILRMILCGGGRKGRNLTPPLHQRLTNRTNKMLQRL
ncbi:MAG: hypothetical protein JW884_06420 [Deltaproteobacteria bacterium]|nr:hypothetical protein [Deltaproteobacteria bacterium]